MSARTALLLAALATLGAAPVARAGEGEPVRGKPADAPRLDLVPDYFQGMRVEIDGSFQDWAGPKPVLAETLTAGEHEFDWTGPGDLSAEVRVQHNDAALFVHVRVRDNAFKAPEGKLGADTVDLWFDLGPGVAQKERFRQLRVDPTWIIGKQALEVSWQYPRALRDTPTDSITAAAALVEGEGNGYEVELAIPFDALGPAPPVFEPLGFCVVVNDWDHDDKLEEAAAVSTCPFEFASPKKHRAEDLGRIVFETRERIWRGIARTLAGAEAIPQVPLMADVGGDARREEIAVVDGRLVVLGLGLGPGEWYAFDLGLSAHDSVVEVQVAEAGGTHEVMVVTVRRAWRVGEQPVEQDVATVFGFVDGSGISDPLLAVEVQNRLPDGSAFVRNTLSFGKGGRVTQQRDEALGWTEDSYLDPDGGFPEGYAPLLVPWDGSSSARHQLPRDP